MASLEEIAKGSKEEVQTWVLGHEEVLEGVGKEAEIRTTKAFRRAGEVEIGDVGTWREATVVEERGEFRQLVTSVAG